MSQQVDIMIEAGAHSELGASAAYRYSNCHGSNQLIAKLPKGAKRTTSYAALGTAAHRIAAVCLKECRDAWEYGGKVLEVEGWKVTVDEEMIEGVQVYLDFVKKKFNQHVGRNGILYVEKPMSSVLDEDAWGVSDVVIEVPGERLIVVDFKYGMGVVVEPTTPQTKYYGYLATEDPVSAFPPETVVELWIVQPRIPHPKGLCRQSVTTVKELTDWFQNDMIGEIFPATRDPNATLKVGPWCRFCAARENCPALKSQVMEFTGDLDPVYLTGEELGDLLVKGEAVRRYLDMLEDVSFKRLMAGEAVKGYKLVRKDSKRVWKDDAELELVAAYGDGAYDKKLKSPAGISNLEGGKKLVAQYAYKPDTGLTVASESDKREAAKPVIEAFMDAEKPVGDEAIKL